MSPLWHYTHGGKQMEPVTSDELKAHATSGFLRPDDLVWKTGMAAWVKAGTLEGLFPAGGGPPPMPSPAIQSSSTADEPAAAGRDGDRPSRRRRPSDDVYDDRRRRPEKSGSAGLVIGLIVGGIASIILIGGGFAVFLFLRLHDGPPPAPAQIRFPAPQGPNGVQFENDNPLALDPVPEPNKKVKFSLQPNGLFTTSVKFPRAMKVEIGVDSDNPANAIELIVSELPRRAEVARDDEQGQTCRASFMARANTSYFVQVRSVAPVASNCTLIYSSP